MKERHFNYPIKLVRQKKDGGFTVLFPDFSEAITQGNTVEEALQEASDCLDEAIANRMMMKLDIPAPSAPKKNQPTVSLHATLAAKAALYLAMRDKKMSNIKLAKKLHCDEKEIRRLLDPYYYSKMPRIESALYELGQQLQVGVMSF